MVTVGTLTSGIAATAFGVSDLSEAGQDLYYGFQGSNEAAINLIRDTLFFGNENTYYDIEMLVTGGAAAGTCVFQSYDLGGQIKAAGSQNYGNANVGISAGSISGGNGKTIILYRGEKASATPDIVFENGLIPKGTHNDALLHTKSNATVGNFISTSSNQSIASDFAGKNGYVYVIETNKYVDINSTYGTDAYFPEQMEFSVPGGITPSEIVGAYKKQGGVIVGDLISNPNFGGQ